MRQFVRMVILSVLFSGCDGNSGGNPDVGKSKSSSGNHYISITPDELNFTYYYGSDVSQVPGPKSVEVIHNGDFTTYNWDTNMPSWLDLDRGPDTRDGYTMIFCIDNSTEIPVGNYSAQLSLGAGSSNFTDMAYHDIHFYYSVLDGLLFTNADDESVKELSFDTLMGEASTPQTIQLAMSDNSVVAWSAVSTEDWIILDNVSGETPDSLTIHVDAATLNGGTHSGSVQFQWQVGDDIITTYLQIRVSVGIPDSKKLIVDNDKFTFVVFEDETPPQTILNIGVNDGSVANWEAYVPLGSNWLSLDKTSGTTPDSIALVFIPSGFPLIDNYQKYRTDLGEIGIRNLNTNEYRSVSAWLTVRAITIKTDITLPDFKGYKGDVFPAKPFNIEMTNDSEMAWSAVVEDDLVTLDKYSGITPDTVLISLNVDAVEVGWDASINSIIRFTNENNGRYVRTGVQIHIQPPTFNIPDIIRMNATVNGPIVTESQTLTTINDYPINWELLIPEDITWLSANKTSGVTPDSIDISADPTGFTAGTYIANVAFKDATHSTSTTTYVRSVRIEMIISN